MRQAWVASIEQRERHVLRINSPAFVATIALHALAVVVATYVSTTGGEQHRPIASGTLTLIDLTAESGAAADKSPPVEAAATARSLAAATRMDAPPAPVAISVTPVVGQPSGSPGSSSFDPYAGASPVRPTAEFGKTDLGAMPQAQGQPSQEAPLNDGLVELRDRIARIARGARGYVALQVLVDSAGIVRAIRITGGDLAPPVSGSTLSAQVQGLKLFPTSAFGMLGWHTLPIVQL